MGGTSCQSLILLTNGTKLALGNVRVTRVGFFKSPAVASGHNGVNCMCQFDYEAVNKFAW